MALTSFLLLLWLAAVSTQAAALTNLASIVALSKSQLDEAHPVRVEGTIISVLRSRNLVILQSGDAGVCVMLPYRQRSLSEGQAVRVEGVTEGRRLAQIVSQRVTELDKPGVLPEPAQINLDDADDPHWLYRRVEVTGVMLTKNSRPNRAEFTLQGATGSLLVQVFQMGAGRARRVEIHSRIRVRGAITQFERNPLVGRRQILVVGGWDDVEVLSTPISSPFDLPVTSISELASPPSGNLPATRVHLRGQIEIRETDGRTELQDEMGLIPLVGDLREGKRGDWVDVVGYVDRPVDALQFRVSLIRQIGLPGSSLNASGTPRAGTGSAEMIPVLRKVDAVRGLSAEELQVMPPVRLRGNVVGRDDKANRLYVQDRTGGITVMLSPEEWKIRDYVEVDGYAVAAETSPRIRWPKVRRAGSNQVASPIPGTPGGLMLGRFDSQWVRVEGVGHYVERNGRETVLVLERAGQKVRARMQSEAGSMAKDCVDARISLCGVARTLLDIDGHNIGSELLVAGANDIKVLDPAPADPADTPAETIAGLKRFRNVDAHTRRVRTIGTVTLAWPRLLFLADGRESLKVRTASPVDALPGERIQVLGFPRLRADGFVLEDAEIRSLGEGGPIRPRAVEATALLGSGRSGAFVSLEGTLLNQVTASSERLFVLQQGSETFPAVLPEADVSVELKDLRAGSRLRISGVLVLQAEQGQPAHAFRVLLPAASSVEVLAVPSWWTPSRLVAVMGAMSVAVALAMFWATYLYRRTVQSEERFVRALHASPVAVCIIGVRSGCVRVVNERFARVTGIPIGDACGLRLDQAGFWPDAPPLEHLCASTDDNSTPIECSWYNQEGVARQFLVNSEPIEFEGENCLLMSAVDITEKIQLLERIRDSQKMEAVGRLAAGVAHDFNNLLTVIRCNSECMKEMIARKSTLAELNDEVDAVAIKAADLVGQLLAFSRKQMLQMRPLDVVALARESARMLRRVLPEHITVETGLPNDIITVEADHGSLEQVLLNLAVNARDAMPDGGVLQLGVERVDLKPGDAAQQDGVSGPGVLVSVSDTGCGMDEETRSRVFEPFFTTKEIGRGTGLGLATAYGIIRQHRGAVEVASRPGEGTCFSIYLPSTTTSIPAPQTSVRAALPASRGESILLIEDEVDLRMITARILERSGYHVYTASNGSEGLQQWETHHEEIDLLLTDIIMPGGMNGFELADTFRKNNPRLKVVLMTGYSGDDVGFDQFESLDAVVINKPFAGKELTCEIRKLLDSAPVVA